jgi:secretion/DNA translocation related CpaE-like protein
MQAHSAEAAGLVVMTTDSELLDHVLAVAAVARVDPRVLTDVVALRAEWSAASIVVLGIDVAPRLAGVSLARRTEVYLVGDGRSRDELSRWSVQLGAAVVALPDGATSLATAMAEHTRRSRRAGRLIAVIGGVGGVGCSTVTAGLSFVAARMGCRTLLMDCDPLGGGIDLLVGAERLEGWRWPRLAAASGELGDVGGGQLPQVDGVDVLSMARTESTPRALPPGEPGEEAMQSVLSSAGRCYDLVVADVARTLGEAGREVLGRADEVMLVAPATVRGISATRRLLVDLREIRSSPAVLVRLLRASRIDPETVADSLGLALLDVIADEPTLLLGAERGDPPGRSSRSPLTRTCGALLGHFLSMDAAA